LRSEAYPQKNPYSALLDNPCILRPDVTSLGKTSKHFAQETKHI